MDGHEKRLQDVEGAIILLKGMSSAGSGPSEDGKSSLIDALNNMIENLRQECQAKFAGATDLDELRKAVSKLKQDAEKIKLNVKDIERDLLD